MEEETLIFILRKPRRYFFNVVEEETLIFYAVEEETLIFNVVEEDERSSWRPTWGV